MKLHGSKCASSMYFDPKVGVTIMVATYTINRESGIRLGLKYVLGALWASVCNIQVQKIVIMGSLLAPGSSSRVIEQVDLRGSSRGPTMFCMV